MIGYDLREQVRIKIRSDGQPSLIFGDEDEPSDLLVTWHKVSPTLPPWFEGVTSFTFFDEPHSVRTIGFNMRGGGSDDLSMHAWGMQWEYSYKVSEFGDVVCEWFVRFRSAATEEFPGGIELRPISANVNRDAPHLMAWGLRGEGTWEDDTAPDYVQRVKFNRSGLIDLNVGAMIRNTVNNQAILLGKLFGGGSMFEMVRIDVNNWIAWDLNPSFTGSYFASLRGVYVGRGTPLTTGKALFQVDSVAADKGSIPAPRMSTAQIATLATTLVDADKGLMVYNHETNKYRFWNGATFETITSA